MPFKFSPGPCNNCGGGCSRCPCTLPAENLALAYDGLTAGAPYGEGTATGTLTYQGNCEWEGSILTPNDVEVTFSITGSGCTCFDFGNGLYFYGCPTASCCDESSNNLSLSSYTCSPLNIVLEYASSMKLTITL